MMASPISNCSVHDSKILYLMGTEISDCGQGGGRRKREGSECAITESAADLIEREREGGRRRRMKFLKFYDDL